MTIRLARQADIPSIARVHVDAWRTTYRGIVPDSYLDALSYPDHEKRHDHYMSLPGAIYLVADLPNHGVVGFLSGGRERTGDPQFTGELFAIYLLAQHHRQGIGSALVQQWADTLQKATINSALVWVLADNKPAVTFYKQRGAKYLRDQTIEIGGVSLKELAYGWENLNSLSQMKNNLKESSP